MKLKSVVDFFLRSPKLLIGTLIFISIILISLIGMATIKHDPLDMVDLEYLPPSPEHPLGTDAFGRDLYAEMVFGIYNSLRIGVMAGLAATLIGVVIGAVAAMLGLKYGPLLPIVGLAPHGIIEVPAFIIQCTAILRWHIAISTLLFNLIRREKVEKAKVKEDLMDVVILSAISIFLLFIAALIETYVTPSLIKLVEKNVEEFRLQSQPFL